ncbi:NADH:flavin oxidoreductase [Microvirga guangxiensis]|uniref:NADPH2 dehydrogenase n=1 Tax=Microvirga guangxiensis TaxID=549386 RepID=A0A1G5LAR6_9HYPH|nr:NADH:flavin oxidoreductase [Microvirga guangxiensis]SCZ10053.1 NADPH2 dehydrogenase [Microvirga guangxiensis]
MSLAFEPLPLGPITLKNRIVLPPMQQYQGSSEGYATQYHVQHYARRARGGVGLIIIESTAVSPEGRLMADDIGLFSDDHIAPLADIARAVSAEGVPALLQLSHGGRKSRPHGEGRLLAPSAIAYNESYGTPEMMAKQDIASLISAFVQAAHRSVMAGFAGVELHAAHGYLLHQFLSPLSNHRKDAYGGSAENRRRLLAEIITEVRAALGPSKLLTMRVSASDYDPRGLTPEHVANDLRVLAPLGLDAVHISSGGLLPIRPSDVSPGYQVGFAEIVRRAVAVPVIAVGMIRTREQIEAILAQGQADLVAIGRPLLIYPDLQRVL